MREQEPVRVQELPLEAEVACDPVLRITRHREVDRGEVYADLVRAPRLEPELEERVPGQHRHANGVVGIGVLTIAVDDVAAVGGWY